jgi:hypothetical protein
MLYRAEALRKHQRRKTTWKEKVTEDPSRALAQAKRWRLKEPGAEYYIASLPGDKKVPLEDLEAFLAKGKR